MKKILLILAAILFVVASCGQKDYFAFADVEYVKEFPSECELGDADTLDVELMGVQGIKCFGDYLLVSCAEKKGCLSTVSLKGKPKITNTFLMIGSGPGEVLYPPFISWMSFYKKGNNQEAGVYGYNGSFLELDISQDSLSNGFRYLSRHLSTKSGSRYFYVSPNCFLCRRSKTDGSGFERVLVDSLGNESHLKSIDFLNSISASEHNLLSSSFAIDEKSETVAELSSYFNAVHLYSLNGKSAKTVVVGNKLQNIRDLEGQGTAMIPRTYYDVHPYTDFFAALYVGATLDDFDEGKCAPPMIHLFDWTGKPIAKIQLPVKALLFDIDTENNAVFVVDNDSEKILRYELPRIAK